MAKNRRPVRQATLEDMMEHDLDKIRDTVIMHNNHPNILAAKLWEIISDASTYVHDKSMWPLSRQKIVDGISFAHKWHYGQKRLSGDPFLLHPMHTAYIIAVNSLPQKMVVAGTLHDVLERNVDDWQFLANQIYQNFGGYECMCVKACSTNKDLADVDKNTAFKVAKVRDFRDLYDLEGVEIVKIVDNICNMREIKYLKGKNGFSDSEYQQQQLKASRKHYLPWAEELDKLNLTPLKFGPYLKKFLDMYQH